MEFGRQRPTRRLISLTPLIDVVFILLIFFMLASSYLDWRSVDLTVSSGAGAATSAQRAILISLRSDGSVTIGSRPVGRRKLRSVMTTRWAGEHERRVMIRSEPGVSLQRAIRTLDLLRSIGAKNVSLTRKR